MLNEGIFIRLFFAIRVKLRAWQGEFQVLGQFDDEQSAREFARRENR